jgi:hypothetical protein
MGSACFIRHPKDTMNASSFCCIGSVPFSTDMLYDGLYPRTITMLSNFTGKTKR